MLNSCPDGSYGRARAANSSKLESNGRHFSPQAFFIALTEGKSEVEPAPAAKNQKRAR